MGLLLLCVTPALAQTSINEICPNNGIQVRGASFDPGGVILTAFDSTGMWVYDIDRNTRYPLPETAPCTFSCYLSPDARWLTYLNPQTYIFGKMRIDGTGRESLVSDASEVRWWSNDTLLVWTPDHRLYLQSEVDSTQIEELPSQGVMSVQPNGYWALAVRDVDGDLLRYMVDLQSLSTDAPNEIRLAPHRDYFNMAAWSPDGTNLGYVGQGAVDETVGIAGGEIFLAQPNNPIPQQMTFLSAAYGASRINGFAQDNLAWSPDSTRIAFWVTELLGNDPTANLGNAVIHMLDVRNGNVMRYCGFATTQHTPNTPRIVWSPDSTHIAFAGDVPQDGKGTLLLAMDVTTGQLTELSNGIFPAPHIPDVTAWGQR